MYGLSPKLSRKAKRFSLLRGRMGPNPSRQEGAWSSWPRLNWRLQPKPLIQTVWQSTLAVESPFRKFAIEAPRHRPRISNTKRRNLDRNFRIIEKSSLGRTLAIRGTASAL